MPDPRIPDILRDRAFRALSRRAQVFALREADPEYSKLTLDAQLAVLDAPDFIPPPTFETNPPPPAAPPTPTEVSLTSGLLSSPKPKNKATLQSVQQRAAQQRQQSAGVQPTQVGNVPLQLPPEPTPADPNDPASAVIGLNTPPIAPGQRIHDLGKNAPLVIRDGSGRVVSKLPFQPDFDLRDRMLSFARNFASGEFPNTRRSEIGRPGLSGINFPLLLPSPEEVSQLADRDAQLALGILRGFATTAQGLSSPESVAIAGGAGALNAVGRGATTFAGQTAAQLTEALVSAGFSAEAATGAVESFQAAGKAETPGQTAELATQGTLGAVVAGLTGAHAIRSGVPAARHAPADLRNLARDFKTGGRFGKAAEVPIEVIPPVKTRLGRTKRLNEPAAPIEPIDIKPVPPDAVAPGPPRQAAPPIPPQRLLTPRKPPEPPRVTLRTADTPPPAKPPTRLLEPSKPPKPARTSGQLGDRASLPRVGEGEDEIVKLAGLDVAATPETPILRAASTTGGGGSPRGVRLTFEGRKPTKQEIQSALPDLNVTTINIKPSEGTLEGLEDLHVIEIEFRRGPGGPLTSAPPDILKRFGVEGESLGIKPSRAFLDKMAARGAEAETQPDALQGNKPPRVTLRTADTPPPAKPPTRLLEPSAEKPTTALEARREKLKPKAEPSASLQAELARLQGENKRLLGGKEKPANKQERLTKLGATAPQKLRKAAEGLGKSIDGLRSTGTMNQNPTPRRAGIIEGQIADREVLESIQRTANNLADAHERGDVPEILRGVDSKAAIETLRRTVRRMPRPNDGPDFKRLMKAGIDTDAKFDQAREALKAFEGRAKVDPDAEVKRLERELIGTNIPGFFPTPAPVVSQVMDAADIREGQSVLEPSAGKGDLAIAARVRGGKVTTVERFDSLRKILKARKFDVAGDDALTVEGEFDKIVMNPPFEQGADADHVQAAFERNLKPGGRLVAIMSEGTFFRSDKKATAFREWLDEHGGTSEKLPEKSFTGKDAFRQTGVASRLVVLEKPEAKPAQQPTTKPPASTLATRPPKTTPIPGRENQVIIPGNTKQRLPVRYAVRDAADVFPSANPGTLQANPEFAFRNDRDYSDPRNAERILADVTNFEPAFHLTDTPTATDGPPIIDANGNVLGGNRRAIVLDRVRNQNAPAYARYREQLTAAAERFGLDAAAIAKLDNPVLVREVTAPLPDPQKTIRELNERGTADLTGGEQSVSDSRRVSISTIERLSSRLDDLGESGTLAQALDDAGPAILDDLIRDGAINLGEKARLIERGRLTPAAKDRISKTLLGRVFRDPAQFDRTDPSIRNNLERSIPHILRIEDRAEFNLLPDVQQAIDVLEYSRASGVKNLRDLARQKSLDANRPKLTPRNVALAEVIQRGPLKAARAFRQYANEAELSRPGAPATLFDPPKPAESFRAAFGPRTRGVGSERGALQLGSQPSGQPPSRRLRNDLAKVRRAFNQLRAASKPARLRAKTELLDRFAPIEDLTRVAKLSADSDPYVAARLFAGHYGRIQNRLDGLQQILTPVRKDLDVLREHATLERFEELAARGIEKFPGDLTADTITAAKQQLESSIDPAQLKRVQQAEDGIRAFSRALLTEARDAGILSDKSFDAIIANNEKYIPLQRTGFLADNAHKPGGPRSFSVSKQNIVKSIQGSEREIIDPLESLVRNTYRSVNLVERNKVARKVYDLADDPLFADTIVRLKPTEEVPPGFDAVSVFVSGLRQRFAVPSPVAEALNGMNIRDADIITQVAARSGRMLRAGATSLNLAFIPSNALRDFQTATLVSQVGFTPFDWVQGFASALRQGPLYREFLESGASFSGYFEQQTQPAATLRELTRGRLARSVRTITNPVELLRIAAEKIELAPRIGVFARARRQGLTSSGSAFTARNSTVDFARSGSTLRVFNMWTPFLNARLQGNTNLLSSLKNRPRRSAWILTALVGLPALVTWLHSTTNFPEIYDDIAGFEKDNNFLLIYGDGRDEQGNPTDVLKIPKGDVGRIFGNPLENYLEYTRGRDAKSVSSVAIEMLSETSPVSFTRDGEFSLTRVLSDALPPAVKVMIESGTNRNLFTDAPIVPRRLLDASPRNQFTERTSPLARAIGDALNLSPLKIDAAISTQFGGLGRQLVNPPNAPGQIIRRFSGARRDTARDFDTLRDAIRAHADERLAAERDAQALLDKLRADPRNLAEFRRALRGLVDQNAQRALESIADLPRLAQRDQLTPFERSLKTQPAAVRARILHQKMQKLDDPRAAGQLLLDWETKKILTPAVAAKLAKLVKPNVSR